MCEGLVPEHDRFCNNLFNYSIEIAVAFRVQIVDVANNSEVIMLAHQSMQPSHRTHVDLDNVPFKY